MNKKTIFGAGTFKELPSLMKSYGDSAFVLAGKSFPERSDWDSFTAACDKQGLQISTGLLHGEPDPSSVDSIVDALRANPPAVVVAIGGGSVMDAGKAVSAMLRESGSVRNYLEGMGTETPTGDKIPMIAVPTTAGTGSEATKNAVISEPGPDGFKKSLRHDNYVPDIALIDPELSATCQLKITAASGLDAFTQLLESFISTGGNTFTDALCWSGLTRFIDSFMTVCLDDPRDISARADLAYGGYISGIALANAGLGTVHGIAGPLGGLAEVPHGVACANLLVPVMNITVEKLRENPSGGVALEKIARLGRYVSGESGLDRDEACDFLLCMLNEWVEILKIPFFSSYGIEKSVLEKAAEISGNKSNPVALDQQERLKALLHRF